MILGGAVVVAGGVEDDVGKLLAAVAFGEAKDG